jgi:inner membrane protein
LPLPVAHGLLGATIVAALHPNPTQRRYPLALLVGALFANAADGDFLLVFAFHNKSWHRGFTHSIAFALISCLLTSLLLGKREIRVALVYGLAVVSHGALDFITSRVGGGVALLWPFSTERMKLGWWGLSETPSNLTAFEIIRALGVEFVIFAALFLFVTLLRKKLTPRVVAGSDQT